MNEWRPIETAPKTGERIDLWVPRTGRICNAAWSYGDNSDPAWSSEGWLVLDPEFGDDVILDEPQKATHWMPTTDERNRTTNNIIVKEMHDGNYEAKFEFDLEGPVGKSSHCTGSAIDLFNKTACPDNYVWIVKHGHELAESKLIGMAEGCENQHNFFLGYVEAFLDCARATNNKFVMRAKTILNSDVIDELSEKSNLDVSKFDDELLDKLVDLCSLADSRKAAERESGQ